MMIDLKNTRLLGHRGARNEAPENTLFGFQHAHRLQKKGLSGVEFDVQLTADGQLIVFHDDTLQRLCGLQARVDQLNLHEIQRHTQSGHPIITLDRLTQSIPSSIRPQVQAAKLENSYHSLSESSGTSLNDIITTEHLATSVHPLTSYTHIELEIKTHERTPYPKLIQALVRYLLNTPLSTLPLVLTSFDRQLLSQMQRHRELSSLPRGLLIREPNLISSAPNTALQLGCTQLGIYYPLLNERVIQYCHRYQLPVSAWTVNNLDIIKQLVDWQVDVIITDIPTQLL